MGSLTSGLLIALVLCGTVQCVIGKGTSGTLSYAISDAAVIFERKAACLTYLKVVLHDEHGRSAFSDVKANGLQLGTLVTAEPITMKLEVSARYTFSIAYRVPYDTTLYSAQITFKVDDKDSSVDITLKFAVRPSRPVLDRMYIRHWIFSSMSNLKIALTSRTAKNGHPLFRITSTSDHVWKGSLNWDTDFFDSGIIGGTYRLTNDVWEFHQGEGVCLMNGWGETMVTRDRPAIVNDLDFYSRRRLTPGTYRYEVELIRSNAIHSVTGMPQRSIQPIQLREVSSTRLAIGFIIH